MDLGDDLPELPSLRIPEIDGELEDLGAATRSPLRSNYKQQQAQRLQLLREGSRRMRDSLPMSSRNSMSFSSSGSATDTAQTSGSWSTPLQQHKSQLHPQLQPQPQPQLQPQPVASTNARTYDMASRLASNFYRRSLPLSTASATQWDDSMWSDLAELLNSSFNGREIDAEKLPGNVYGAFPFLGHGELEDRVRALIDWTVLQHPEASEMQQVSRPYDSLNDAYKPTPGQFLDPNQHKIHAQLLPRHTDGPISHHGSTLGAYGTHQPGRFATASSGAPASSGATSITNYGPGRFSAPAQDPHTPPQPKRSWE